MDEAKQNIGGRTDRRSMLGIAAGAVIAMMLSGGILALDLTSSHAAGDQGEGSGLPLPRFASLKSDHVNVRGGPDKDHEVAWIYVRPALPVEITEEFENWRRIRDRDGSEGWVYHTLLSGRRTAVVAQPRSMTSQTKNATSSGEAARPDLVPLHTTADNASPLRAMLEPGVLGTVKKCTGQWCRIMGADFDGWVEQRWLWGVYPNEKID